MNENKDTDIIETELNKEGIFVPITKIKTKSSRKIKTKTKNIYHKNLSKRFIHIKQKSSIEEILEGFSTGLDMISQFKNIIK